MKTLSLLAALTVLAGVVPAKADTSVYPKTVTYDAKNITPGTSVDSIKKDFTDSEETTRVQRPNGDTYLVLTNDAKGTYRPASSPEAKVDQITTLALVVGKDGKIKSYAMEQKTYHTYRSRDSGLVSRRDMGSSCFSDCDQSASKTLAASTPPVTKTPAKSVVSGSTPKEQTAPGTSPLQDQAVVSPSAP